MLRLDIFFSEDSIPPDSVPSSAASIRSRRGANIRLQSRLKSQLLRAYDCNQHPLLLIEQTSIELGDALRNGTIPSITQTPAFDRTRF